MLLAMILLAICLTVMFGMGYLFAWFAYHWHGQS